MFHEDMVADKLKGRNFKTTIFKTSLLFRENSTKHARP